MRSEAIEVAVGRLHDGSFLADLSRRVAIRSESQHPARPIDLRAYLDDEIGPSLEALGFSVTVVENPLAGRAPLLVAQRLENAEAMTVLAYGHGDVVPGYDDGWTQGDGPWKLAVAGERVYGRGTADNKGQHCGSASTALPPSSRFGADSAST